MPGTIDVGGDGPPLQTLALREQRVRAILGVDVAAAREAEILRALDFATSPIDGGLEVTVPALRRDDVTREVDLIEEVARIDGLERLPATLPARRGAAGRLSHAQRVRRAAEDAMRGRGLFEIVGWSFTDPGLLDRLRVPEAHPLRAVVRIENPLSEDLSVMRPTLLGSLLDAARHNVSRGIADVAIFESGGVYRAREDGAGATPADEHQALGALLCGALGPRSWRGERPEADFFTAKALLGGLLDRLHVDWRAEPAEAERWPFLHPGRSAAVIAGGRLLDARLPRRGPPARRGRLGPAAHGRVRDRPRQARRGGAGGADVRRVRRVPGAAPGHRRHAARRRLRRGGARGRARGGRRRRSTGQRSSMSTPASRWGRGAARSRWR